MAPAEALQVGDLGYAVDLTDAEPGDGAYVVGQADQEEQELVAVAADPAATPSGCTSPFLTRPLREPLGISPTPPGRAMKNLVSRALTALAAGALAIAIVVATSSPAQADVDAYTPHGGPVVDLSGDYVDFTFVEAGQTFICENFDMSGTIPNAGASRLFGAPATTWSQVVHGGCTNPIIGDSTFDPIGAWQFAITGPEVGSVSPAAFTNVALFVQAADCAFNIAGEVSGVFDDATGVFTSTGSSLVVTDTPTGFICPILGFEQGHTVSMSGSWTITGLTITNP